MVKAMFNSDIKRRDTLAIHKYNGGLLADFDDDDDI